ncbi:Ku protein [Kaistia dalseonensis]|uniref:Non-homologous end joining protein Ku n=1 Tax=Kaistia dalseonensis TaxID=410840 RepID=A0ABU0H0Q4_9HYPH|nr:Ku protein [Kaistia dalseonensis]MCX5493328.1 Ku protein [Kaistia dalseonensis]MDQ0435885.1 DNA end-binding protein Ku [Kaistia dalseonensis]
MGEPRANWKGQLKIAALICPVALYSASSTSERVTFHTINRKTGNRVQRRFVDSETGEAVDPADQVKGYEVGPDDYIQLDPDDVAAAVPESDKTLSLVAFVPCAEIDDVYFDRPYYLAPAAADAHEVFALLRDTMRRKQVAALVQTVLFRRVRTLLVRPLGDGLVATTLNFNYEVRPAEEAFAGIPDIKIAGEMLDLARHIIETKHGTYDPSTFDDRYEAALAELVKAKIEGRKIRPPKERKADRSLSLLEALRESAAPAPAKKARATAPRRRAG